MHPVHEYVTPQYTKSAQSYNSGMDAIDYDQRESRYVSITVRSNGLCEGAEL